MDKKAKAFSGLHGFIGDCGGHHRKGEGHGVFGIACGSRRNHLREGAFIAAKAGAVLVMAHEGAATVADHKTDQMRQTIDRSDALFVTQRTGEIMRDCNAARFVAAPLPQQIDSTLF